MELSHVVVDALSLRERLEADPTRMCVTACAGHMVAPRCALDGRVTAWAFLHVVTTHPFLEKTVPSIFAIRTGDSLVVFDMARHADACKA